LWLACRNADGVRGRKQELYHFLGQHEIDICLLTEIHLRSRLVLRMVNCVCHPIYWLIEGDGTAILVSCSIGHQLVPVKGLEHLLTLSKNSWSLVKINKVVNYFCL